jgi:hypothetical protein
MTLAEAYEQHQRNVAELRALADNSDFEYAHGRADEILSAYAPADIREAWTAVKKHYA